MLQGHAGSVFPDALVTTTWLASHIDVPEVQVVDIRGYVRTTDLGGGRQRADYLGARDEYEAGHIPGAVFVDWTRDITDPDNPVKAQIAPPDRFARAMAGRGSVTRRTSSSSITPAVTLRPDSGGRCGTTAMTGRPSSTEGTIGGWLRAGP